MRTRNASHSILHRLSHGEEVLGTMCLDFLSQSGGWDICWTVGFTEKDTINKSSEKSDKQTSDFTSFKM